MTIPAFFQSLEDQVYLEPVRKGYRRVTLHHDDHTEVASAYWQPGGRSDLHGHGDSAAIYYVQSGVIQDERFVPEGEGYRFEVLLLRAGEQAYLPAGSYHRVRALEEAVTVHTYWPPPSNATQDVPPGTLRLLRQARRRMRQAAGSGGVKARSPRSRPDLLTRVRDLLPAWAEREERATRAGQTRLPAETLTELRNCGILAAPLPEHLGGWNASLSQTVAAVRLLAQHAPSTALALVMALGNAATTRIPLTAVPEHLQDALLEGQHWIAAQVRQGRILAVANSEPGAGGDLKNTRTTARRAPDGVYHLTGRKAFATFGPDADYFLCAARRGDGQRDVIDGFFVSRHAPGLTVDDCWNPVGLKPTASVGLTLRDAPAEAIMGYPGCLEGVNSRHWSTVLFAAVFLGLGERALREACGQAGPEAVWARGTLAEKALNLEAAAGFVESVAGQESWPMPAELQQRARRAKTFVARVSLEVALHAAMISGGRAYTPDHPVFRCLCDALAGPLLRPPLPKEMDTIVQQLFARPDVA
jgi:alkylation response protein AidB-like acyl-CoA dehydrogenase